MPTSEQISALVADTTAKLSRELRAALATYVGEAAYADVLRRFSLRLEADVTALVTEE